MLVSAWSLSNTWGNKSLRGPRVPIKKPKLLKLQSINVIKTIHEYGPSCSKNLVGDAMMILQPGWLVSVYKYIETAQYIAKQTRIRTASWGSVGGVSESQRSDYLIGVLHSGLVSYSAHAQLLPVLLVMDKATKDPRVLDIIITRFQCLTNLMSYTP